MYFYQINENLKDSGKNFGNIEDVYGAMKGLIQLQMAYKLDPYKMAKGQLEHRGVVYSGQKNTFGLNDMANLITLSASMNYMDSSIAFLKGVFKLGKERSEEMEVIKDQLKSVRKQIVESHNDMLRKRKKVTGVDFRGKKILKLDIPMYYLTNIFTFG